MEFKPLSYLQDAVRTKNTKDIRIALISYIKKCLGDTQEIMDALGYVEKSLSVEEYESIWEAYDGVSLELDKSKWSKSYFASVEVDLDDNFSKERFDHILEVGRYVYGTTEPVKTIKSTNTSVDVSSMKKGNNKQDLLPILIAGGGILILGVLMLSKMMKK